MPVPGQAEAAVIAEALKQYTLANEACAKAKAAAARADDLADEVQVHSDDAVGFAATATARKDDALAATDPVEASNEAQACNAAAVGASLSHGKAQQTLGLVDAARNEAHAASAAATDARLAAQAAATSLTPNPPQAVEYAADALEQATAANQYEDAADDSYDRGATYMAPALAAKNAAQTDYNTAQTAAGSKATASLADAGTARDDVVAATAIVTTKEGSIASQWVTAETSLALTTSNKEEVDAARRQGQDAAGQLTNVGLARDAVVNSLQLIDSDMVVLDANVATATTKNALVISTCASAAQPSTVTKPIIDSSAASLQTALDKQKSAKDYRIAVATFVTSANAIYAAAQQSAASSVQDAANDGVAQVKALETANAERSTQVTALAGEVTAALQTANAAEDAATTQLGVAAAAQLEANEQAEKAALYAAEAKSWEAGLPTDPEDLANPATTQTALSYSQQAAQASAAADLKEKEAAAAAGAAQDAAIVAAAAAATAEAKAAEAAAIAAASAAAAAEATTLVADLQAGLAANPGDPYLTAKLAEAQVAKQAAFDAAAAQDTAAVTAAGQAALANAAADNTKATAQAAGNNAELAKNAAVAAAASQRTAANAAVSTAEKVVAASETMAQFATEVPGSEASAADVRSFERQNEKRLSGDASLTHIDAMEVERKALAQAMLATDDPAELAEIRNKLEVLQQRFAEAIATHSRSAFVFSERANYRVQKRDGKILATPLMARTTSPHPDEMAGLNRPYFQVMKAGEELRNSELYDTTGRGNRFEQFILTSINLVDVEKMDVVETFGNPHFFASGRFTKKLSLNGVVRAEARVPALTTKDKRGAQTKAPVRDDDQIPDAVMFSNYYEEYMRATKLASTGGFVRLFVDGDFFDGFVQNFQMSRDSNMEALTPWTMTMILFRHWNVQDNKAKEVLRKNIKQLSVIKPALSDRQAQAEITDAIGETTIEVSMQGTAPSGAEFVNAGTTVWKDDATVSTPGSTTRNPAFRVTGAKSSIRVECPELGRHADLVYLETGEPVRDSTPALDTEHPVGLKILNFSELKKGTATQLEPNVSFVIRGANTPKSRRINFPVKIDGDAAITPQLWSVKVIATKTVNATVATSSTPKSAKSASQLKLEAGFSNDQRATVVQPSGDIVLDVSIPLVTSKARALALTSTDGVQVTLQDGSLDAARDGAKVSDLPDSAIHQAVTLTDINLSGLSDSTESRVAFKLRSKLNPVDFKPTVATRVELTGKLNIVVPSFGPLDIPFVIKQELGVSDAYKSLLSGIAYGSSKSVAGTNRYQINLLLVVADANTKADVLTNTLQTALATIQVSIKLTGRDYGTSTGKFTLGGGGVGLLSSPDSGPIYKVSAVPASFSFNEAISPYIGRKAVRAIVASLPLALKNTEGGDVSWPNSVPAQVEVSVISGGVFGSIPNV